MLQEIEAILCEETVRLQLLLLSLPSRDGRNHSGLEYDEEVHGPRGQGRNRMFLRLSISML
jgi:hypothetical protein